VGQLHRQPAFGVGPTIDGDLDPVDLDRGDGQQGVQFDDQSGQGRLGGEVQHGDRVDGLVFGQDLDRQIGLVELHRLLFRRQRLIGGKSEGGRFTWRRRRLGDGGAGRQRQGAGCGQKQNLDAHEPLPV
jgi:hypothetical protein